MKLRRQFPGSRWRRSRHIRGHHPGARLPRSGDTGSLSQLMDKDQAAAPPGTQVTKRPDLYDKDSTPFNLVAFAPAAGQAGDWKAVAYSEEGEYLLAFTLDAKSKAAYDKNLPVFTALVQHYAKDIPW